MKKTVVVDVDGVLHDIHAVIEKILHEQGYLDFSMSRSLTYDFNKSLKPEQAPFSLRNTDNGLYPYWLNAPRDTIYQMFREPRIFEESVFPDAMVNALRLLCRQESANVVIATQSYTPEVAQTKKRRIDELLKGCSYKYVDFIGSNKGIVDNADYVIEDCIANLDRYDENGQSVVKILVDRPYNSEKYNISAKGFRDILRSPDAASALRYVLAKLTSWDYVCEQLYGPERKGWCSMTIREMRQRTGLSQSKFAKVLNIPVANIARWEQGVATPPYYVVELIEYRLRHDGLIGEESGEDNE